MSTQRTVLDCLRLATSHLQASGSASPRLDAEVLLAHVLGLERIQLYVQHDRPLVSKELDAYRRCIARRARREPVAYIVGRRDFLSFSVKVDSRVLIPRPETELLVETALSELEGRFGGDGELRVADIGTGSGVIAIGVAARGPRARVIATDLDPGALALAQVNVEAQGLAHRIELRQGDLFEPLAGERFHAILSNPPYISRAEWESLPDDVRAYEPKIALLGGEDGLEHIRRLIRGVRGVWLPGGFMALEVGAGQGAAVREIARAQGLWCEVRKDLAGLDRIALVGEGRP